MRDCIAQNVLVFGANHAQAQEIRELVTYELQPMAYGIVEEEKTPFEAALITLALRTLGGMFEKMGIIPRYPSLQRIHVVDPAEMEKRPHGATPGFVYRGNAYISRADCPSVMLRNFVHELVHLVSFSSAYIRVVDAEKHSIEVKDWLYGVSQPSKSGLAFSEALTELFATKVRLLMARNYPDLVGPEVWKAVSTPLAYELPIHFLKLVEQRLQQAGVNIATANRVLWKAYFCGEGEPWRSLYGRGFFGKAAYHRLFCRDWPTKKDFQFMRGGVQESQNAVSAA